MRIEFRRSRVSGRWLELLNLEGVCRIDSLVVAFEQAIDQKAAERGNESLTETERAVLASEALEREVNNGGYNVNDSRGHSYREVTR